MKKILMALGFVMFTMAAFAGVNKGKAVKEKALVTKSNKQVVKVTTVECTPSTKKVFHTVNNCGHFSWYTVDYVETTIVTCVNGVAVENCYHWDQDSSLLCS